MVTKLLLVGRPESVIIHRISSLQESLKCNDRILLFSQSLFTLNLIEDFLKKKKLTNVEVGVRCPSINLNNKTFFLFMLLFLIHAIESIKN